MADLIYDGFISDSRHDRALAARLQRLLEGLKPPGGRYPLRVFLDTEELSASASLTESIHEALVASEFLIVVASPRSAQSRWVRANSRPGWIWVERSGCFSWWPTEIRRPFCARWMAAIRKRRTSPWPRISGRGPFARHFAGLRTNISGSPRDFSRSGSTISGSERSASGCSVNGGSSLRSPSSSFSCWPPPARRCGSGKWRSLKDERLRIGSTRPSSSQTACSRETDRKLQGISGAETIRLSLVTDASEMLDCLALAGSERSSLVATQVEGHLRRGVLAADGRNHVQAMRELGLADQLIAKIPTEAGRARARTLVARTRGQLGLARNRVPRRDA